MPTRDQVVPTVAGHFLQFTGDNEPKRTCRNHTWSVGKITDDKKFRDDGYVVISFLCFKFILFLLIATSARLDCSSVKMSKYFLRS